MKLLAFLIAVPLAAQTGPTLDQLRVPTPAPIVIACLPPGAGPAKCIAAKLSSSVFLDTATGEIRAALPAEQSAKQLATAEMISLTLPTAPTDPGSLVIVRNGVEQSEGEDYSVAGRIVTFLPTSRPQAGDLVKYRYR
jgi:hypothetical protein